MTAGAARRVLEDRAFETGGSQFMNAWERLATLPWPGPAPYREALEDAAGDPVLTEAVRTQARQHLERMRSRRMAGGAEDAALRDAAGLPSWREEQEAREAAR